MNSRRLKYSHIYRLQLLCNSSDDAISHSYRFHMHMHDDLCAGMNMHADMYRCQQRMPVCQMHSHTHIID